MPNSRDEEFDTPVGSHQRTIGVVVIGRNEGQRLVRCLESALPSGATVVYVDSNSTDDSVHTAGALGAHVVELSLEVPFTAGRARNAGFARLIQLEPGIEFVQFVDGDCTLANGWLEFAADFLRDRTNVAIVCGRRKELYPERSLYNRLCDIEWNTPIGDSDACGGDFMVRAHVFHSNGGFNGGLIAGEEPELCYRLRREGWLIHRADRLMTFHDAAMEHFHQWARRCTRSGYAYAARAALHWKDKKGYCWKENARILFWALILPIVIALLSIIFSMWWTVLVAAYLIQFLRAIRGSRASEGVAGRVSHAFWVMLSKWPELFGQVLFAKRLLRGQEQAIIEYK